MSKIISLISFIFSLFISPSTQANNTESNMNTDTDINTPNTKRDDMEIIWMMVGLLAIFVTSTTVAYKHALTVCPTSDPFFGVNFINAFGVAFVVLFATVSVCLLAYVTIKKRFTMHQIRTFLAVVITVAIFVPMILQVGMQQSMKAIIGLAPLAFTVIDLLLNVEYHAKVRELVISKQEVADLAAHNARVRAKYEAAMSKFLVILFFVLPTQAFAASTQEHSMQSNFPFIVLGIFALIVIISMGITNALEARKQRIAAAAYLAAAPEREAEELAYQQRVDAWRLEAWWKNADAASVAIDNKKIMANHYASESTINGIATVNYMHTQDAVANGTGLTRASIMKIKLLLILFFVFPTQAFAATQENIMNIELDLFPHLTADKEMGIALLSLMVLMSFVAFFATNNYFNKKQAQKLAAMQRIVESEREQTRRFYAVQEWNRRQQRIEWEKEQAKQALIQAEQEKQAEKQAEINREIAKALQAEYEAEAAKAEEEYKALVAKMQDEQKLKEIQIATFSAAHQLNVSIAKMDLKEFWMTFDKKEHQPKFTWDDLIKSCEHFNKTGNADLFFENATIQGIRQFWWVLAQKPMDQITAVQNDSIFWFFSEFISFLERFQSNNSNNKHSLGWRCSWLYSPKHGSSRILTKMEMEALDLVVAKKGWEFLEEWTLPVNDAATGGLFVAMAKDDTFADEVATIKTEAEFWHSMQMNTEKSLWKAAQWKIYMARYKKVKTLKENMWAMFAKEGVATCRLTTDIVVGFDFKGERYESCDVADTDQIAKILSAGYDQVLRIRRTDAAGIWQESQQINVKYTGNFCTGRGPAQENGYYQSDFKSGKLIPWIADIQINGEWDNFGVILSNSAGVVDYGMGNDNRSSKHQQILYRMFGKGSLSQAPSAGQLMLNKMVNDWFTHREFNINHAAAEIKQKLAAAVDNQIW